MTKTLNNIYDAIANEDLEMVKDFYENLCEKAAVTGNIEILDYLHKNGCPWNERTCAAAAENGKFECLKYLHRNGCPWNKNTCANAAKFGNIEILKYLHENECPWDEDTCNYAATNKTIDCLQYAHENGCPRNDYNCICYAVETGGCIESLKYLYKFGCRTFDEELIYFAANNFDIECLKWLHENGCPWDENGCAGVVDETNNSYKELCPIKEEKRLECLKWLHENGCPWDEETLEYATRHKYFKCEKYAYENGCPIPKLNYCYYKQKYNNDTPNSAICIDYNYCITCKDDHYYKNACNNAAKAGHLDCLKNAYKNECEWGKYVYECASRTGNLDCLMYAHEIDPEWDKQKCITIAIEHKKPDIVKYINTLI